MIQANELRIGNLVNSKNDGIISITNISEKSVAVSEAHCYNHIPVEFISPIPLTEEWLLKLGFKKRKNRHLFHWENKIVISEYKDEFENFFYPKTGYDIRFSNEIKYVHQLQNLYFALTGAELTVA